ncbi:MAG: hypothetical protein OEW37_03570 [Rhodospirillaceae bacterium]|nr:hypothetical protein [Rhodospirillaceae bacterium]
MKKFSTLIFILVVASIVGGGIFLSTWDIPAPVAKVEKVIPDERFQR